MELLFCDLCQEAVPQADVQSGQAFVQGERVVCGSCNRAMGGPPSSGAPAAVSSATSSSGGPASPSPDGATASRSTPRRPPQISSTLGGVLGLAAIVLTLVAVVALLLRVEMVSRGLERDIAYEGERIREVEQRQLGTRDGMVARARSAAEEAVYGELGRFDDFERQLAEVRRALAAGEPDDAESRPQPPREGLLTLGDAMDRVEDLEQQILFLQARVFELLEEKRMAEEGETPLRERVLLPTGKVGELVAQLEHEDPIERVSALFALATVDEVGIVRHITPLLKDEDAYIRALSARILEKLDARSAVSDLVDALGDRDVLVREAAVSALRAISGQSFGFDPRGPGSERFEAVKRWKGWWGEAWKSFLYSEE